MKYASNSVVWLFLIVAISVALVDSQNVSPRGPVEYRVRGGSSGAIVANFDNGINSQAKERRIKGEKEAVSDEDEKDKEELVIKGKEKGEKESLIEEVDKGDDKRAKKEKPKEKDVSAKEAIKETDKLTKEESSAPTSAPGVAAEETTSPAPTVSPTCVECDDFGR